MPLLLVGQEEPQIGENEFSFRFQDKQYVGFLDIPSKKAKAIILLIPGSGKTDFLGEGGFAKFFRQKRERFLQLGFAVCAWDKLGFAKTLQQIKIPVLAILGEKDSQVDWRKTEQ